MTRSEQPVVFRCGSDELLGIVHHAKSDAKTGIVIVVGGPQYRVGSHRQFALMARSMADRGFPVMRFDYRGMGDSGGGVTSFEHVGDDINAAVEMLLRSVPSLNDVILWGLCDAASAVLMNCRCHARLSGAILANPWVRTQAGEARAIVNHYYGRRFLQRSFWVKLLSGGLNPITTLQGFLQTYKQSKNPQIGTTERSPMNFVDKMRSGLMSFGKPVLMLISGRDLVAQEFMDLCKSDDGWRRAISQSTVRIARLDNADHTFSQRSALESAIEICHRWLDEQVVHNR